MSLSSYSAFLLAPLPFPQTLALGSLKLVCSVVEYHGSGTLRPLKALFLIRTVCCFWSFAPYHWTLILLHLLHLLSCAMWAPGLASLSSQLRPCVKCVILDYSRFAFRSWVRLLNTVFKALSAWVLPNFLRGMHVPLVCVCAWDSLYCPLSFFSWMLLSRNGFVHR